MMLKNPMAIAKAISVMAFSWLSLVIRLPLKGWDCGGISTHQLVRFARFYVMSMATI
jgi:hypothetical protein